MYRILKKRILNEQVTLMQVEAPLIAKKAEPGQFIILRVDEEGERIPLTIADFDRHKGSVTIIFQLVGKTTRMLGTLNEGDFILDFAGPLGRASHLDGYSKVAVIGGGLGCAIAYPQAKKLHTHGASVDIIAGFRNTDLIILEEEMRQACENLIITTDDGSNGVQGFVTDRLKEQLDAGVKYDMVISIGPLFMMRAVCNLTREYNVKTMISMNPVMIDGTGMCGGCRVIVDGETKFACVDGPDFDGHLVDFDSAIRRSMFYRDSEKQACDEYSCRMGGGSHA